MDCDTCGRYRPSSEIAPLREPDGGITMVCSRCRRLSAGRRPRPLDTDLRARPALAGPSVLAPTH
jgi:hypothetical protein